MNAIILSGGVGSRLYPLTEKTPKPMLPLANRPVLDYAVSQLYYYGIKRITFTLAYKAEIIREHALSYKGIECSFSHEKKPLGTAGAVKLSERNLDKTFVVVSGDGISDINLGEMYRQHESSGAEVTMAVTSVKNPCAYGVVQVNEDDIVTGFVEKPKTAEYGNLVNTGVYIINKSVLSLIPSDIPFDFSRDLFPSLVKVGKISAYLHDGYWCDIGDKKSYFNENFHLIEGGFYPFIPSKTTPSAYLKGSLVGENTIVIGKITDSIIGKNARVASSARLNRCVVQDGVTVTGNHYGEIICSGYVEKVEDLPNNGRNKQNFMKNFPNITP